MYKPIEAPVEKLVHCLLKYYAGYTLLIEIISLRLSSLTIDNLQRSRGNM